MRGLCSITAGIALGIAIAVILAAREPGLPVAPSADPEGA